MPYNMIIRGLCEICSSTKHDSLISKPFTDSSVFDFIDDYYECRVKKEDLEGHFYEIVRCKECGFMWQKYILDDTGMNKLYADWISKEHSLAKKERAEIDLFISYSTEVQEIAFLFDKKPCEINVLDFGMGWGFWCLMAKAHCYNVYGYELSQDRIDYAEKLGINVMKSIDGYQDLRFDFIYSNQVFEHIPHPAIQLEQLAHLLKNEGIIKLSVPDGDYVHIGGGDDIWKANKDALHPLEHINCFNKHTLNLLGIAAGLKTIDVVGSTVYYMSEDSHAIRNIFAKSKQTQRETNENWGRELFALKNSYSYKLGRFITYPFRYLRNILKI